MDVAKISRRSLLGAGAALLAGTTAATRAAAFSDAAILRTVHPELRDAAAKLLRLPRHGSDLSSLASRRAVDNGTVPDPAVPLELRVAPGLGRGPDVPVYVINARPGKARPAIVHMHGGAFVAGSAKQSIRRLQDRWAVPLDCVVASVEYRLAPETDWRGSTEDNYAALLWLYRNAEALGVDRTRIAVMGESAGGGHAALLALKARDRGEVPIVFQSLTYPMLDDRTGPSHAPAPWIGALIHGPADNRFGWRSFLGMEPGGRGVPVGAVPARAGKLAGLPPAFIGVGGIDLFVDEDVDYAQRLNAAGVPCELIVVPGAFHVFDVFGAATRVGKAFIDARREAMRAALYEERLGRDTATAPAEPPVRP